MRQRRKVAAAAVAKEDTTSDVLSARGKMPLSRKSQVLLADNDEDSAPGHGDSLELDVLDRAGRAIEPSADGAASSTSHLLLTGVKQERVQAGHGSSALGSSLWLFTIQVFPSLLLAGAGLVSAGILLDIVQHWDVYVEVTELITLVPALLGLKGNLEMTLVSRLSTAAAQGAFNPGRQKGPLILANMLLVQVQAIFVGTAASLFAVFMGWIFHHEFSIHHALLVMTCSVATASIASGVLSALMSGIVVASKYCNITPNNVAAPLAAAMGDLGTLSVLSFIATGLHTVTFTHKQEWVSPVLLCAFVLGVLPISFSYLRHHAEVYEIFKRRWTWLAVLIAMMTSSLAGVLLERFMTRFQAMAALAPVINGIGGNLGAVQASRISTSLHAQSRDHHTRPGVVLFLLVLPISLLFLAVINGLNIGHVKVTPVFVTSYLLAAMFQVGILLSIVKRLVRYIWDCKQDPDNIAIPFVTALGDLLGTAALTVCFVALARSGNNDADGD